LEGLGMCVRRRMAGEGGEGGGRGGALAINRGT
jgi:hypothetical protein